MRFAAPEHASDVTTSSGVFPVEQGFVELPEDTSPDDIGSLQVNGFTPAPAAPARKAPVDSKAE
jgi:hypothetical protein